MIDLQMSFNYSDKDKEKLYQRLTVFFYHICIIATILSR